MCDIASQEMERHYVTRPLFGLGFRTWLKYTSAITQSPIVCP